MRVEGGAAGDSGFKGLGFGAKGMRDRMPKRQGEKSRSEGFCLSLLLALCILRLVAAISANGSAMALRDLACSLSGGCRGARDDVRRGHVRKQGKDGWR